MIAKSQPFAINSRILSYKVELSAKSAECAIEAPQKYSSFSSAVFISHSVKKAIVGKSSRGNTLYWKK